MGTTVSLLAGKKTYLAAFAMAVLGVVALCLGDVPQGLQAIIAALTTVGLRGAITQSQT